MVRRRKKAKNSEGRDSEMSICAYNILSAGGNRLEQVLRCMRIMNMDLGILTETKLVQGYHTTKAEGYDIVTTEARSTHQGGVALFYRKSANFHIEGTRSFGPNVIRATLVSGRKRWRLVGAYIPPGEEDGARATIECIQAAAAVSSNLPLILLGDFNVDLKNMIASNDRQAETAALIATMGVEDLNQRFVQRKGVGDWTWFQKREGRYIYSRCDYILTSEPDDFLSFRIKNPRYESDHRMLVSILRTDSTKQHRRYVKRRTKLPKFRNEGKNRADVLLEELEELIEKPRHAEPRFKSWISEASWKLIDSKAEARRCGDATKAKRLARQLRKSLRADRKSRIEAVSTEIEALLKADRVEEAYGKLRGWYRDKPGHVPKPTIQDEEKTRLEYQSLFTAEESPGDPIPIHVTPTPVDDSPPTEKEICEALKGMRRGKSPGGSGIRVEHLLEWMRGATGETPDPAMVSAWKKVLELVDISFTGKPMPKSFGIGILVLIPKGGGQYRGIALLEVIYKLVSAIINRRMAAKIDFHHAVHGFRSLRGTGTAIIEAKLRMQLAQRSTKPCYFVFLDLKKAYDTLDRQRTLDILEGYGVGSNIRRIIADVWCMDTMVPKQAGFYGKPFGASRGVRQGDIMSPIIFNIVADTVIRDVEARMIEGNSAAVDAIFYADDGLLIGENNVAVQNVLDMYTDGFSRVGLKMNATKTKALIMAGGNLVGPQSAPAYERRFNKTMPTHRERMAQKVHCELCGREVNRSNLKNHQMRQKCKTDREDYQATTPNSSVAEEQSTDTPELPEQVRDPTEYFVCMTQEFGTPCPVEGCPAKPVKHQQMCLHFRAKHIRDTIIINGERLPRCVKCGLFQKNVGPAHQTSVGCKKATKVREGREADEIHKKTVAETVFTVEGIPIETVTDFKYLGRVVNNSDGDGPTVHRSLQRARATWGRIGRVLSKEGADPKTMASFYKAVVQSVLLYGSESWTLTLSMEKKLQSFHRRCARYVTGQHIRQNPDETWTCPSSEMVLEKAGLWTIQEYIRRRRATVKMYAASQPIFQRCRESSPLASNINQIVWWNLDEAA
jgi:exonuclease III